MLGIIHYLYCNPFGVSFFKLYKVLFQAILFFSGHQVLLLLDVFSISLDKKGPEIGLQNKWEPKYLCAAP